MIVSVTLNPAVDHQIFVEALAVHDTNRVARTEIDAGGKGVNLSRVFAELGGQTLATGFLGGNAGAVVRRVLELQGVSDSFVSVAGETRTNVSVEDHSGRPPTTFNARGPMISESEWEELLEVVARLAKGASWVCLGGSLPPGVGPSAFHDIGVVAKAQGAKVLLDADGEPCREGLRCGPSLIKPNSKEASRLLGRPIETTEEAIAGAKELLSWLPAETLPTPNPLPRPASQVQGGGSGMVVISRGEHGAVLACADGVFIGQSAPVHAKSTIGSGDSFLGGMLWAMEDGRSLEEAFAWGLAAGAATATTDGTGIARRGVTELLFRHCSVERVE